MFELRELEEQFRRGQISRRQFLSQISALGLAAMITPTLLAGKAGAAAPKKGGLFTQALTGGSTTDSLDPGTLTSNWNQNINFQVRNNLVEIDHNFNPIPELAESWEASPDARVWTFKIRKGVEFHNGKTLVAEDVAYSINHHRGEKSKSAAKPLVKPIADIRTDGNDTVIFELESGNADFPFILSDYHLSIVPAGTKGDQWEEGMGTGGYVMQSWEPGVRAYTKRNPNYWKEGRAHFNEVETLSINDVNARTNALKTGQLDFMDRCELKTVHLLQRMPGIEIMEVTGTTHFSMPMLVDRKPYNDNNVRLGLKYALDRRELVNKILLGFGQLGNDHPISPVNRFFNENLPQREYDPDKARFYMKKGGALDYTFKLSAADAAFLGAVDAAVLFKEHAKKAGINIKVIQEPNDGYWSNVWIKKEWCMCYWSGRPTEDMMFSVAYASGAPWNDTHWEHERFNRLLKEARAELDKEKRGAMYAEIQRIVNLQGGVVIPMFPKNVEAAQDTIQHGPISGHKEADGMRNAERWWFAS